MIRAFLWFLVQIPLILIGPLVVACMLPFRKTEESTRTPYTRRADRHWLEDQVEPQRHAKGCAAR